MRRPGNAQSARIFATAAFACKQSEADACHDS
jgi:hypothetical protein